MRSMEDVVEVAKRLRRNKRRLDRVREQLSEMNEQKRFRTSCMPLIVDKLDHAARWLDQDLKKVEGIVEEARREIKRAR